MQEGTAADFMGEDLAAEDLAAAFTAAAFMGELASTAVAASMAADP